MWEIEYTEEFEKWWVGLSENEQIDLDANITVLKTLGPKLNRPYCDTLNGSRYGNMKELRTQSQGKPLRTFFAFDPRRTAILLIGGDKKGDDRFYERMIPIADDLYSKHLEELEDGKEI